VDAPKHVFEDGKAIDELPLESFYGEAIVVDVPKGELGEITAEDLERVGQEVREGDIVLLHTGWGKYFWTEPRQADYLAVNHPGLVESAAVWLVEKKIKAVGIDCFAVRHPKLSPALSLADRQTNKAKPTEPVHYHLLKNDIVIVEQLMNLEVIAGQRVTVAFFPLPFVGIDGSPVRAVAIT
jgi:kynurenine formamidase